MLFHIHNFQTDFSRVNYTHKLIYIATGEKCSDFKRQEIFRIPRINSKSHINLVYWIYLRLCLKFSCKVCDFKFSIASPHAPYSRIINIMMIIIII